MCLGVGVEVGGHPAHQEGEAKELLSEVSHIPLFSPLPPFFFFIDSFATNPLTIVKIFDCYACSFLLLYRD